jgi:hypothetical protein
MALKIITANVKNTMTSPKIKSDILEVERENADFILWQEMHPRSHKILAAAVRKTEYQTVHTNLQTPISVRKSRWRVVDSGYVMTHRGKAGISPNRYVAWVIVAHRKTGRKLVVTNSHYVSGAWYGRYRPFRAWRQTSWREHHNIYRNITREFHRAGYTVVGGGDWNHKSPTKFMPEQYWLHRHWYDYLFVVNNYKSEAVVKFVRRKSVKLFSDHDALVAYVTINSTKNPVKARPVDKTIV